jgi:epoxyqueuosine reductase
MNYHSTLSTRTLMKLLGLGGMKWGSRGTGSAFHDIDEVISSPLAQWKRPWWVKSVDNPTVEIDWDRMQRFDGRKMMQVSFVDYVGKERNRYLRDHRNKKTRQWIIDKKPGYTLADRALDLAGRTGTVDPTFLGAWKKSTHIGGVWAGDIFGPDQLNVPRWNGSPEENARLVRAAIRHFGADQVGFVELNEHTRKLIYSYDALDGKAIIFEDVDEAYETEKRRVIPNKAQWVIVFSVQMSEEQIKLMVESSPTPLASAATGLAYARARNILERLQNFLHLLGYQGLMGTWYNGLGIAPALGVMAGLGELGRTNRIISPEYGPLQRVFKVITDLPLAPTKPIDAGIMQFCRTCRKCAEACPSGALSMEPEPSWDVKGPWNHPGVRAYFDDGPRCYSYWLTATASCARCFAVCPFSTKQKSFVHKLVMATLAVTPLLNPFFAYMHTAFGYGASRQPESWWDCDLPPYGIDTARAIAWDKRLSRPKTASSRR